MLLAKQSLLMFGTQNHLSYLLTQVLLVHLQCLVAAHRSTYAAANP